MGGGNGDSKTNRSNLVFILNPNRRPFLTPKPPQINQKVKATPENNNQDSALDYMGTMSPAGTFDFSYVSQPYESLNPPESEQTAPSTTVPSILRNIWELEERPLSTEEQNHSCEIAPSISSPQSSPNKDESNLTQMEKPLSLAARRLMNHNKPGGKEIVVFKKNIRSHRHHPLVSSNNSFSL